MEERRREKEKMEEKEISQELELHRTHTLCALSLVIGVSGLHCVQRLSMIACCQDLSDKYFLNTVLVNLGPLSNTICSSNPCVSFAPDSGRCDNTPTNQLCHNNLAGIIDYWGQMVS